MSKEPAGFNMLRKNTAKILLKPKRFASREQTATRLTVCDLYQGIACFVSDG